MTKTSRLQILTLALFAIAISCNLSDINGDQEGSPVFSVISPADSGIEFQNVLEEGLNTNILMYEYFYNGGGVAAADFNGDGLTDVYFSSNMGNNALYINKGNLKFEEIAFESGVTGRPGPWKTGVSAVDVNGDGRMDLYLCYSGALPPEKRRNQMFINSGNNENNHPTFVESAGPMGLASEAFSTQAYFFDYDRDGDLDMLLLNHNPKNLPILNEVKTKELLGIDDPLKGVRLLRQDDGFFNDVTVQSGISSSELTYGLGVGIADFNTDGWPDFYVSNDYSVPDYLYINKGDGQFVNTADLALRHISHFSMGNDVGDLNNDGYPDIVTLDMLPEDNRRQKLLLAPDEYAKFDLNVRSGFHHQYMRNMLQLNNGDGSFSEIGQLAGISNTDWSWSALLADYDNDGFKDLYVTNGYFRDYTNLDFINYMNAFVQEKGRLQREDVLEIIQRMPSTDLSNYMFKGERNAMFNNVTSRWGLHQASKSNGAAYADFDNDGDLELIVNNINEPAFLFKNRAVENGNNHFLRVHLTGSGKNTSGIGAAVILYSDEEEIRQEHYLARGYQSSVAPGLHFGLGTKDKVDSLVIQWPSGKLQTIISPPVDDVIKVMEGLSLREVVTNKPVVSPIFTEEESAIRFTHGSYQKRDFDRQPLLLMELSEVGPCMASGDINGDGHYDVFIGGSQNQSGQLYLGTTSRGYIPFNQDALSADAGYVDCDAQFIDVDMDGDLDLFVVSGGYHDMSVEDPRLQDRLYINDGSGRLRRALDGVPPVYANGSCVSTADVNLDGFPDLFVGGRAVPGRFPEPSESYLLINDGTGRFRDQTEEWSEDIRRTGMVTDAEWTDLNDDDIPDLIVVGEWMPLTVYVNESGKLVRQSDHYFDKAYNGMWNTLAVGDLNDDGLDDLIVGNLGKNVQFRATDEQPCTLYYHDFDDNGSLDPIFSYYMGDVSYPFITRDELRRQLAPLAARYPSFESYADATIEDIVGMEALGRAEKLEMTHQETSLFLRGPDDRFYNKPLPVEAQYAPIYAIVRKDFDGDGNQDLLMCGNNSSLKLRLGSVDANYGFLMKGTGDGSFEYLPQALSGLSITGDVRSILNLGDQILVGVNQGEVLTYKNTLRQVQ